VAALYSKDACYLTQHYLDGIVHPRPLTQGYVQRGVEQKAHLSAQNA